MEFEKRNVMESENDTNYRFKDKWSAEIDSFNFTQIPNLLLSCQGHLKLKDGELLTLIHLITFWYKKDGSIFPSINTLTKFSGNGYSTVQRRLRILEEKGFVERIQRLGTSSTYSLQPCIDKLLKHCKDCPSMTHSRGVVVSKSIGLPLSYLINKEDEGLSKQIKEKYGENDIFAAIGEYLYEAYTKNDNDNGPDKINGPIYNALGDRHER